MEEIAIPMLDSALRSEARPDKTYRFVAPCPDHQHGDEARLDFSASGWPRSRCAKKHGSCEPVWRIAILCEKELLVEYLCDAFLPDSPAATHGIERALPSPLHFAAARAPGEAKRSIGVILR
jgi:hypothetical protein